MDLKRLIAIFLSCLLLVSLLTGCSGNVTNESKDDTTEEIVKSENVNNGEKNNNGESEEPATLVNESGMPIVNDPITVKIMAYVPAGAVSYDEMLFSQEMEARSNIKVDWIEVSPTACTEKVNLALASDDLPDAFLKCNIPITMQTKYMKDQVFVPLNQYLDTYMVNFNKALNDFPDLKPSITLSDGNIYGVPYVNGVDSIGVPVAYWNKKFFDRLGLTEPKTTDEFYEVLLAVKDGDPNENGEPDEIPLLVQGFHSFRGQLGGAFGLGNRGSAAGFIDANPNDKNKVRFWPIDDNYRKYLDYIRKLWESELIDPEIETNDLPKMVAKANQDIVGFAYQLHTQLDQRREDFAPITQPLVGPDGMQMSTRGATALGTGGQFVITKAAQYPEALARWVDYFFEIEGMELYFMGIEGETFTRQEDGRCVYVDSIVNNPDGLSYVQAFGQYLCWGDGRNPALLHPNYFQGAEMFPEHLAVTDALQPYMPEEIWAPFAMNDEEAKFFSTTGLDIEDKVAQFEALWITGKIPNTDEEWNKYIQDLNHMGLDDYIKYQQKE